MPVYSLLTDANGREFFHILGIQSWNSCCQRALKAKTVDSIDLIREYLRSFAVQKSLAQIP